MKGGQKFMEKYNIITPKTGRDGFYDESLPWIIINTGLTAEEANKSLGNLSFTAGRVLAENPETGERFHFTTKGLRSLNSYGA